VPRRALPLLALVLAAIAAGCGEKEEPDLSNLPPPPQPQPPTPPRGLPQAVIGSWEGTLDQKGIRPFPIRVSIVSATDPQENIVHYGGQIDCSGTWSYLDAEGPDVRFRERIDSGAGGDCQGTGTVTVRPQQNRKLAYRFTGGGVTSSGVLSELPPD
jgi:hypothetical protein